MADDPFGPRRIKLNSGHRKLLYLLSKYGRSAESNASTESWIREIQLQVLIFEGIVAHALDYDYAPQSMLIGSQRIWMNISQEGKDALDDLREAGLVDGLKLSTEELFQITAYQATRTGMEEVRSMDGKLKLQVDDYINSPKPFPSELLLVRWEGADKTPRRQFVLYTDHGYNRVSEICTVEEVSYVSSPYLPLAVRKSQHVRMTNNAHRAREAAEGQTTIKDRMDERITVAGVSLLVGEWVPFGSNQLVALNEKLGSEERCKGGMFTAEKDIGGAGLVALSDSTLTRVRMLDHSSCRYVNFEAEINYPEELGVVQVEHFGVHFNKQGSSLYGMHIEAIGERVKQTSLDQLCRLVVDLHQDSSIITESLLSFYQRDVLEMIFNADHLQRAKYSVIVADSITPKMNAQEYLEDAACEAELRQVLGGISSKEHAKDLDHENLLVLGRCGLLMVGPAAREQESLLVGFLALQSMDTFLQVFFSRTFVLSALMHNIRTGMDNHVQDPLSVPRIRLQLSTASRDIILLRETLTYLSESTHAMTLPPFPKDLVGIRLWDTLDMEQRLENLLERINDLNKNVDGCQHELESLVQMTDVINTKQLEDIFNAVEANTKDLVVASAANKRASASLQVMQIILAASMAFDLVDRFTGLDLNLEPLSDWQQWIIDNLITSAPGVWFAFNMVWCAAVCFMLIKLMKHLQGSARGFLTLTSRRNDLINIKALWGLIDTKSVETADSNLEDGMTIKKVAWDEQGAEHWCGPPPRIELMFQEPEGEVSDETNGFLLTVSFILDQKSSKLNEDELWRILSTEMRRHGVFDTDAKTDNTDLMGEGSHESVGRGFDTTGDGKIDALDTVGDGKIDSRIVRS